MKIELRNVEALHLAATAGHAPALSGVSLAVSPGEQLAVIGPSGAGKTTLLQVLACSLQPAAGTCWLSDENPWTLPRAALQRLRGRLFLAPQVPPMPPRQRVVTSVMAGALPALGLWRSVRSLFYPVDIPGAHAALAQFDMADKLFDRVDRLSGGERQRVGLARALLAPAGLWLIDEPLSALDPTRAVQAMHALVQGAQARGVTLVTTLHQVDMALAHFPRIVGLREGSVAFDLPAAKVTSERLAHLYAQHEDELRGLAPAADLPLAHSLPPAVMHCR